MLAATAHRVTVNTAGSNLRPPAPRQRFIQPDQHRSGAGKDGHELGEQQAPCYPRRPTSLAQDAMVFAERARVLATDKAQHGGAGALAWCQHCADQQQLHVGKDPAAEQARVGYYYRQKLAG